MRYEDKLLVGLSIEMIVHDGEYEGSYRTRIEELGVRILSIGVPIINGQYIPLREGTSLTVIFCDDVSAYSFSSVIINRFATQIPTFIIQYPNKIDKVQRRQYVRLPITTPFNYSILEKDGLSKTKRGCILDLSGGGLSFKAKDNLSEKTIIIIRMEIGDVELEVSAAVIRCVKEEEGELYKISAEFHEISENIRDRIIRYILDIQRELRKKGLI